jgi:murein DD-endopeptidase MepM/ murein hydrolase activator NlpD
MAAAGIAPSGGRVGNPVASGRRRSSIKAVRALFAFLTVCAGCALISGETVAGSRSAGAGTLLLKPIDSGRLTSDYGPRYNPVLKRRQMHRGIDWAAPRGTTAARSPPCTPISIATRPGCAWATGCARVT